MTTIRFMPTFGQHCEDRDAIVARLTRHYEKLRQKAALLAEAKAGEQEPASETEARDGTLPDLPDLDDLPSAGEPAPLRRRDNWSAKEAIRRRAARLADAAAKRNGHFHLKGDPRKRLLAAPKEYRLAGPATEHQADEIAAALYEEAPWMGEAIERIWRDMRLHAREGLGLKFRPVLLDGPPGIGKTHLALRLGELSALPTMNFDAGSGPEGFRITGVAKGWGSAYPSQIVESILDSGIANPVVFIDEIDKAGFSMSSKGHNTSIVTSLLVMLEPRSAAVWDCPFYQVRFDMAHVNWLLASNDLSRVPEPLLTRVRVIRLEGMDHTKLVEAAERRCKREDLPDAVVEDVERLLRAYPAGHYGLNMRTLNRIFEDRARLEGKSLLN